MAQWFDEERLRADCKAAGVSDEGTEILVLRVAGELRFDTIAAMLGKKEATVRAAFNRASNRVLDYRERSLSDPPEPEVAYL